MEGLWTDFRQAWRAWRRAPAAAMAITALLALGIGGIASLFKPLYSLVLAPLPFADSNRLVRIGGDIPLFNGYSHSFEHRERLMSIFASVTAYAPIPDLVSARLSSAVQPMDVKVQTVTPEFFLTIGVAPRMGRGFEERISGSSVAVLSERVLRTRLDDPGQALGGTILLDGLPFTVIGVMPESFDFPTGTDVWMLMETAPGYSRSSIELVGRLRTGVSLEQAATYLKMLGRGAGESASGMIGKDGPVLQQLQVFLQGDRGPMLWIFWAVSILFLLLACAGATNILMAQGVRRRPEMAVRLALGAGRWRLVRQLLTETLLLVGVAGLTGTWLSTIVGEWLKPRLPQVRDGQTFVLDMIGFVAALAIALALFCGLAPALHATRLDLSVSLKASRGDSNLLRSRRRLFSSREVLAGAQLALTLMLLIGTSSLFRSLTASLSIPLGMETRGVALVRTSLPKLPLLRAATEQFYQQHNLNRSGTSTTANNSALMERMQRTLEPMERAENARNLQFFKEAQQRLSELPGVVSIGILDPAPFTSRADRAVQNPDWVSPLDPRSASHTPYVLCFVGRADTNGFGALGIRFLSGRAFTSAEVADEIALQEARTFISSRARGESSRRWGVAIINEVLAQRLWPGQSAIGKQFYDRNGARAVIGIVPYFHQSGYGTTIMPAAYYPFPGIWLNGDFIVNYGTGASLARLNTVRDALDDLVPDRPRIDVRSLQELTQSSLANLRLALMLLGCFSLLGTIVAGLGVYSSATLMAAARTREMGIRMALGASATQIRRLALWRSARLIVVALPVGLFFSWVLARLLSVHFFRVGSAGALTYAISSAFLLIVVLVAVLLPALRAASTDPVAVLRSE